jgi:hypothetical protein
MICLPTVAGSATTTTTALRALRLRRGVVGLGLEDFELASPSHPPVTP